MLADMWKFAADRRREKRHRTKLFKIAESFNVQHTYRYPRQEWMCPQCNTVHKTTGYSGLTGLHYPKCCDHQEGHRCYSAAATGWR